MMTLLVEKIDLARQWAERESFEGVDRRVSSERVYRDSARHGSSESDEPSGGGHFIEGTYFCQEGDSC